MSISQTPQPKPPENDVPMPAPGWTPEITEPDPDLLPDELPVPNPDENRDPPMRAGDAEGESAR